MKLGNVIVCVLYCATYFLFDTCFSDVIFLFCFFDGVLMVIWGTHLSAREK